MEIYNENVIDLLAKPGERSSQNLKVRHATTFLYIKDDSRIFPTGTGFFLQRIRLRIRPIDQHFMIDANVETKSSYEIC